jgi:hypothetical protein
MLIALPRLMTQRFNDVGTKILIPTDEVPKFLPADAKVLAVVDGPPLTIKDSKTRCTAFRELRSSFQK